MNSETSITVISPAGDGHGGRDRGDSRRRRAHRAPPTSLPTELASPSSSQTRAHGGRNLGDDHRHGFTGASAVKFGSTEATSFKVELEHQHHRRSPAGSGVVDVTVNTPEGTSPTSPADLFTFTTPRSSKPQPELRRSSRRNPVTITGHNFTGARPSSSAPPTLPASQSIGHFDHRRPAARSRSPARCHRDHAGRNQREQRCRQFNYDGESTCSPRASEGPSSRYSTQHRARQRRHLREDSRRTLLRLGQLPESAVSGPPTSSGR